MKSLHNIIVLKFVQRYNTYLFVLYILPSGVCVMIKYLIGIMWISLNNHSFIHILFVIVWWWLCNKPLIISISLHYIYYSSYILEYFWLWYIYWFMDTIVRITFIHSIPLWHRISWLSFYCILLFMFWLVMISNIEYVYNLFILKVSIWLN